MRRLEKRKVVVDDDWSVLQHCLSANQATGDLLLQVVKKNYCDLILNFNK